MISYSIYKIIHLFFVGLYLSAYSILFYQKDKCPKWLRISTHVGTLLILISGMGLLARIGVSHGQGWPLWAKLKVVLWLLMGVGMPIIYKRFPQKHYLGHILMLVIFLLATITINYKVI